MAEKTIKDALEYVSHCLDTPSNVLSLYMGKKIITTVIQQLEAGATLDSVINFDENRIC